MSEDAARPASPFRAGSFELFRAFGIRVFLHWTWFLLAAFLVLRDAEYARWQYKVFELVALFGIVVLHEFGHALACRSVGGRAYEIVLNPLGGYALVAPPMRPGAELWSIAAGPLVNVVLAPVIGIAWYAASEVDGAPRDLVLFFKNLTFMNAALAIFNLLPIFPLDGGRILRALLWFFVGPATSLTIAAWVGIAGCCALLALALVTGNWILGLIAAFGLFACWGGLQRARMLRAWLEMRGVDEGPR